jgi:integrase/recombinase XerD
MQRPKTARELTAGERYIRAHLDYLKARNYADETVAFKDMALKAFIAWCTERGIVRLTEVTRPVLQRYQRHLYHAQSRGGRPMSAGAQFNRLIAVKGFFRFLTRENVLLYNPASDLELPKLEKRLPKDIMTAEETERVLSQPDITTALGIRDRAILETFYSTGIRRTELVDLGRNCLNIERGIVAVRQGKGKKDRFIPIGERAVLWLEKYLADVRPEHEMMDINTLFLDETGQKMSKDRLSCAVRRYIEKSGVNKQGRCHLFRHTMATLMLENGADIRYIQQMLGHAKLATTEIYTHVSILKLKQVHALTHPARLPDGTAQSVRGIVEASIVGVESDLSAEAHSTQADVPTAADVLAMLDEEAAEEDESGDKPGIESRV